ncbi:MAG: CPBP family intramembrane metalloprotease [Candidatus Thorarchaeota archaeon]
MKQKAGGFGLFVFILFCGLWAVGPLHYRPFLVTEIIRLALRGTIPLMFLFLAMALRQSEQYSRYWRIAFAFFIGSTAYLMAGIGQEILPIQTTSVEGITFTKLRDVILMMSVMIVLTLGSGEKLSTILIQKGKVRLGLITGLVAFSGFAVIAIPGSILLFYAETVTLEQVLSWTPWIVTVVLANALMEETLYRGLFLKRYEEFFRPLVANVLQAMIFVTPHLTVAYTSDLLLFLGILFLLGLVWGYAAQKTDSLLASILFHGGADILIFIGLFSAL